MLGNVEGGIPMSDPKISKKKVGWICRISIETLTTDFDLIYKYNKE